MILYNISDSRRCAKMSYITHFGWLSYVPCEWSLSYSCACLLPPWSVFYYRTNVPDLPQNSTTRSFSIGFSLWGDFILSFTAQLFPVRGLLFSSFQKKKKEKSIEYRTVHICRCCCSWRTWLWRQKRSWNGRMRFWMCSPALLTEPPCK